MIKILQKGEKVLRRIAEKIKIKDITKPKIQNIIKDMKTAMHSQDDAVAIAAPQIGTSLQIFIVSKKVFNIPDEEDSTKEKHSNSYLDIVFINPKIIKLSTKKNDMEEGCLSVRMWHGEVERSKNITIVAYDEKGKKFTRGAGGFLSQIFQHEIDHLVGILFTDKAKNLRKIENGKK